MGRNSTELWMRNHGVISMPPRGFAVASASEKYRGRNRRSPELDADAVADSDADRGPGDRSDSTQPHQVGSERCIRHETTPLVPGEQPSFVDRGRRRRRQDRGGEADPGDRPTASQRTGLGASGTPISPRVRFRPRRLSPGGGRSFRRRLVGGVFAHGRPVPRVSASRPSARGSNTRLSSPS